MLQSVAASGTTNSPSAAGLAGAEVDTAVLELQSVAPERIAALNAFYRQRSPVEFVVRGEVVTAAACWPAEENGAQGAIVFRIGEETGELRLPSAWIQRLISWADPNAEPSSLASEHAALLLEHALSDELSRLEAHLARRIELAQVEVVSNPGQEPAPFVLALTQGDASATCSLRVTDGVAMQVGELLDRRGVAPRLRTDLPIIVSFWKSATSLAVGEVRSLRPGDVVMTDEVEVDKEAAWAVFANRLVAPVVVAREGARLIAGPSPLRASRWEWTMTDTTEPDVAALEDAALEDLPITVVFELGRKAMSLDEVSRLASGAVVPISDLDREAVDLLANGKRIGCGELARIGDGLGVRILRIFAHG